VEDRMPRPRKCRLVGFVPQNQSFYPQLRSSGEVVLNIEEIEAIRLSDYIEIDQDRAAESMQVSRGTYQRILKSSRSKIADALINGKVIRIEGGNYLLSEKNAFCRRKQECFNWNMSEVCERCSEHEPSKLIIYIEKKT